MVTIGGINLLNPLDRDLELGTFVLSIINWKIRTLPETVNASTPVNEELKFLFDCVPDASEYVLPHLLGVVRQLRLELAGVLVDTFDLLRVEVDPEVVREHLELLAWGLGISGWLLWEKRKGV